MKTRIKVSTPASIAHLGVGHGVLAVAVDLVSEEMLGKLSPNPGIRIERITGANKSISFDPKMNVAGVALQAMIDKIGRPDIGIDIEIRKKHGVGRGLGSSASSASSAVVLLNELLQRPLEKQDLLRFAIAGDTVAAPNHHGNGAAASMHGGFQVLSKDADLSSARIINPGGLHFTILQYDVMDYQEHKRLMWNTTMSMEQHIAQSGRLGSFILGLERGKLDLIRRHFSDELMESLRAQHIPYFSDLKELAMNNLALGCTIAGAGPSIFAISKNSFVAEEVSEAWTRYMKEKKRRFRMDVVAVNDVGSLAC